MVIIPHEKRGQQNLLVLRKLTAEVGLAQGHMARVCVLDHSAVLLSRHRQYEAGQQVMRKRSHLSAPRVHRLPQLYQRPGTETGTARPANVLSGK